MIGLIADPGSLPERILAPGDVLITQGQQSGDLFVLGSGKLVVERDGVAVTTLSEPDTLVGEMSILLERPNSATVRADGYATVRVMHNARAALKADADLALRLAALVASRLDATTALLVHLSRDQSAAEEHNLVHRLLAAINRPAPVSPGPGEGGSPWDLVRHQF